MGSFEGLGFRAIQSEESERPFVVSLLSAYLLRPSFPVAPLLLDLGV